MKPKRPKKKYHILAFNWQDITHPQSGGAEVHFHEIFKRLAKRGHAVTLACCHYPGAARSERIDSIDVRRYGNRALFNYYVPFAYRQLRRKCVDIVIDDINKIPFYTPCYVKEPICALVHHLFGKSIYLETNSVSASYVYFSEKLIPPAYRHTSFAAVSQSTIKELREKGIKGSIHWLPNAVDTNRFPAGKRQNKPLIGYFGRLKRYKSVEHFLRAIPRVITAVPDAEFVVLGGGDDRQNLEKLTRELQIDSRVKFTGHVSHEAKVDWLGKMWCAVNTSPKEGWGLTVIEANACATPVVAADSPGLRDSVINHKTGFLYPYGDIESLSESVIQLCKHPLLLQRMSRHALEWAKKFDWNQSAEMALEIIERIIYQSK